MSDQGKSILSLAVDTSEIQKLLMVGKTRLNQMRQSGEFGLLPLKISTRGKLLYSREEFEAWVRAETPNRREWQIIRTKILKGNKK